MRKTFTLLSALLFTFTVNAQRFDWATIGGYAGIANSYNGAVDIATDPNGNVYTIDFGNGDQICQGQTFDNFDSYTAFIYKFNSEGELLLVNRIGAVSGDFYPYNIECDDAGSIYVLGQPNGATQLNINENIVSAVGNTNVIVKINANGIFQWAQSTGYAANGEGCMLQYHNGYVYYQTGALSIGKISTEGVIPSENLTIDYYNTSVASNGPIFKGSDVFSNGDILFAAYSRGTVAFGEDTLFHTGNTALTAPYLFVRCNENLEVVWARFASNGRDPDANFIPVAIDGSDNVYACVQVNQEMTIGDDVITNPENASIGVGSIIKFNSDGDGVWGKPLDETLNALGWCMETSADGNQILVGGGYTGPSTFGTFNLEGIGSSKPFMAFMDGDGTYTNVFNYLQEPVQSDALSLKRGDNGRYHVGGKLANSTVPIFSCQAIDAARGFYIGKFSEQPDIVPQPTITQDGAVLTAGPAFEGEIQWLLNGEEIQGATSPSLEATTTGDYTVEYTYTTGCTGSASSSAVFVEVIGVEENTISDLHLYPNPSSGLITLNTYGEYSGSMHVYITNSIGEIVYTASSWTSGESHDLSFLDAGVYFIHARKPNAECEVLKWIRR